MGGACSNQNKVANSVDNTATQTVSIEPVHQKTVKTHAIRSEVVSETEIGSEMYTTDDSYDSDSDSYYEYDTDNSEYEYIQVSEYGSKEYNKTDKGTLEDGIDLRREWLKKTYLSEVCEDAEQLEGSQEQTVESTLIDTAGVSNISNIINAKRVTKRWKRKVKREAAGDQGSYDKRRDSSLVGVFSAIRLTTKWKDKTNQKKLDDEENIDAISTISVAKRWKKKLRRVRSKIKKKKQETDNLNAAQITNEWKRETKRSKELSADTGEVETRRRKSLSSRRRRKSNMEMEILPEGTEISESTATINVSRRWKNKVLKKPIEEGD